MAVSGRSALEEAAARSGRQRSPNPTDRPRPMKRIIAESGYLATRCATAAVAVSCAASSAVEARLNRRQSRADYYPLAEACGCPHPVSSSANTSHLTLRSVGEEVHRSVLSHDRIQLLETLRDDCDVLISILIREEEVCVVPPHTSERLVKLLRQPRLLFDIAEGWPVLEDVTEAMNLSTVLVNELASELEKLGAWFNTRGFSPPTPAKRGARMSTINVASPQEVMALLRTWCAEVPLWDLRQWLDKRIAFMKVVPVGETRITLPAPARRIRPPPLQPFDEGPSFGSRPVGDDRSNLVEAILLERANTAHEAVLQAMRCNFAARGCECFQSVLIDLVCILGGFAYIVEAKSISPDNEVEQVRHAFAQLRDYRFRYSVEEPFIEREVSLCVALSSVPQDSWTAAFLRHEGIMLVWLGEDGKLAGPDIQALGVLSSKHIGTAQEVVQSRLPS